MQSLDPRLNAFRPDRADARLDGRVGSANFVSGWPARIAAAVADVRRKPSPDAGLDTQFLRGDAVRVFDEDAEWAWVQGERDGYVGYVAAGALGGPAAAPGHVVCVPRTFVYPGPDLRFPRQGELSMGSGVTVTGRAETRGTVYALLEGGAAVVAGHLRPAAEPAEDFVTVAESLLHTPYLWGGTSAFGLDCSGLVQLSMRMAGRDVPRDTDMMEAALGEKLETERDFSALEKGDLVFWKGHMGIVSSPGTLLHASGHSMMVTREPLQAAIERIAHLYDWPTSARRPPR